MDSQNGKTHSTEPLHQWLFRSLWRRQCRARWFIKILCQFFLVSHNYEKLFNIKPSLCYTPCVRVALIQSCNVNVAAHTTFYSGVLCPAPEHTQQFYFKQVLWEGRENLACLEDNENGHSKIALNVCRLFPQERSMGYMNPQTFETSLHGKIYPNLGYIFLNKQITPTINSTRNNYIKDVKQT